MTLTTTLLRNDADEIRQLVRALPKGRRRMHHMEDRPVIRKEKASARDLRTLTTSPQNIGRVHAAIVAGARTVRDIHDATGLARTVIWRAINQLETGPLETRIVRDNSQKPSQFAIAHA
jgi:hypothetical protein